MHVGISTMICPQNEIDTWDVKRKSEESKTILDLVDVESDPHYMEMEDNWKYLGDILSSDGKNDSNIKDRVQRGLGAVTNICQTLKDLCLGPYHYEAAVILRDSLLLSTLLSNSEAWVNLSNNNIKDLESVDEHFLRNIFREAHSKTSLLAKTPLELLYLETGCIPIRFILKSRRLNFLHYILNDKEDSLLSNVFKAQCDNPVKGDWITTVKSDMEEFGMKLTFEEIRSQTKDSFKRTVKKYVADSALNYLKELQKDHSKSKPLHYQKLALQEYLTANNLMTIREKQFTFAARARMIDLKCNFKIGHKDLKCRLCKTHEENQQGLLICKVLRESPTDIDTSDTYSDLYSTDKKKITKIAMTLRCKYQKFKHYQVHGKNKTNDFPFAASLALDSGDMD